MKRSIRPLFAIALVGWAIVQGAPAGRDSREDGRAKEWKVGEILEALGVKAGSRIADIGAGDGFLTVRLAPLVGAEGRVFAIDISERALGELRKRLDETGAKNVEVIQGKAADPMLRPLSVDGVIVLRAYHEFSQYREMLDRIRAALRPGGRLVIADVGPGADSSDDRDQQCARHVLSHSIAAKEIADAGFRIVQSAPAFARLNNGETVWLVTAQRP